MNDDFDEAITQLADSIDDTLQGIVTRDKELKQREIKFWIVCGLGFFDEFYNKGVNCENVDWTLCESIIDWLYNNYKPVTKKIDKTYPKGCWHRDKYGEFKASDFFGDEMDVHFMRDLLNAALENIEHTGGK